jgi:subtilisin family serine protease
MAEYKVVPDLPDTFEPDQLVVHLPHLDLVTKQLAETNLLPVGAAQTDEALDLALLTLTKADQAGGRTPITDLDAVLRDLRAKSEDRYGGWTPLLGKNRHVESVFGLPQPRSHSLDDPVAADPPIPVDAPSRAGHGVRVGVLDTRVTAHPFLIGRFIADQDSLLAPAAGTVLPLRAGHATFVSSLVLAHAPGATVAVRGVLDNDGRATAWCAVQQMMAFADSGIDILNLSLGCRTADGRPPLLMRRATELLSQRMVLVAAAGNHNCKVYRKAPTWPAALPDVVAVGARNVDDSLADFSPRLPWITCTAPGRDILGAYLGADLPTTVTLLEGSQEPFHGYATWNGTSFATAIVSGAIAARTVPGHVPAREALAALLREDVGVVRKYVPGDDGQCA